MTPAKTRSQLGRRNRANGAAYEVKLANYLKTYWPDACRAVRSTTPDPGDVDGTSPSLWWSMKNCEGERIDAWFAEMAEKGAGRIGLLVVRRRGYADPGRWWCWLTVADWLDLTCAPTDVPVDPQAQIRLELAAVVPLLVVYTAAQVSA